MKHHYEVSIRESLEMKVVVQAESREEAERIAEKRWRMEEYILDSENFTGVEFHARKVPDKSRDEGR